MVAIEDYYGPVFKWTWNGRSDIRRMDSVGCFIKDLPVAFADLFCKACSELINIVDHSVSINEILRSFLGNHQDRYINCRFDMKEKEFGI